MTVRGGGILASTPLSQLINDHIGVHTSAWSGQLMYSIYLLLSLGAAADMGNWLMCGLECAR